MTGQQCEIAWFSALCDDDYEFLGVPDDKLRSSWEHCRNIVLAAEESRAFLAGIGIQGEIISTPGHSDDSVTLVLDDGAAFTGDLTPPLMVPEDLANLAYQSWQAIRAKGATTIYPGHGPAGPL